MADCAFEILPSVLERMQVCIYIDFANENAYHHNKTFSRRPVYFV
jgi:hypothetical protein